MFQLCGNTGSHASFWTPARRINATAPYTTTAVQVLGACTSTAAIERGSTSILKQPEKRKIKEHSVRVQPPRLLCKSPFRRFDRWTNWPLWMMIRNLVLFSTSILSPSSQQRARHGLCFCSIDSPAHRLLDGSHDTSSCKALAPRVHVSTCCALCHYQCRYSCTCRPSTVPALSKVPHTASP